MSRTDKHLWIAASLVTLTGALAAGCSKSDSSSDSTTTDSATVSTTGGTTSTAGTVTLMAPIDVSCGGKNCYGGNDAALALGSGDSALQTMRMFSWLIVGFPSKQQYIDTFGETPTEEQLNALPYGGMVGSIESVRKDVVAMAQKAAPTLTSCADAPTSGTFTDEHGTLTWTTPVLAAPASFGRAGTYDKAVTYKATDGSTEGRFEFFCDQNRMAIVIKRTKTKSSWMSFFYDREDKTKLHAQFFLRDEGYLAINNDPDEKLNLGLLLDTDETAGTLTSHVARSGTDASTLYQGYRYAIAAKTDASKISYYIAEAGTSNDGDSKLSQTAWDASTIVNSKGVTDEDGTAANDVVTGCSTGYDTNGTGPDTCSGLALKEAPAPALDADGSFTMRWTGSTLAAKMKAVVP